ncbi:FAD-dependent monooxygenase [Methylosinus sp. LW4]|uniref:FAD-dependent monooxygenase n=1 Tax=Methylosinus sp. LW4 TaxID=136993 RepID=UPI00035DC029|nr:FAD-dependent monooxygenase [Methylosinus sp. LW4]
MVDALSKISPSTEEVDVVVIGAGPVGCASALQLGRAGRSTALFERRSGLSRHPKAGGIHARTMEIFRQWGLAHDIRAVGRGLLQPGAVPTAFTWLTRLNGVELGRIDFGSQADRELWATYSPEGPCFCGQDLYEPILFEALAKYPSVRAQFGKRATISALGDEGVEVEVSDEETGRIEKHVRARYLIAADGVRSPTRHALGVGESGFGAFGDSVNVQFRADLERHRAGRQYGLFWIVNPDTQGALSWRRQADRWSYNFEAAPGEDPQSYTEDRCRDIIRRAVGDLSVEIEILSILHWKHDQAVTDKWRVGRVFFVGDSAHRFPPHGGFGMNSGVQDSANLIWKLDLVLSSAAADSLLDTYQEERKPVAEFNGEQCLENTRRMEETGWLLHDTAHLAAIEEQTPRGHSVRDRIAAAIPRQREQFYSQGQQFGTIYRSAAVLLDGTEPELSTVSLYRPTAHPGARAPHLWLRDRDGRELSTIDLFYDGFVLLAGPDGSQWLRATAEAAAERTIGATAYLIGAGGDYVERSGERSFTEAYSVESDGAVLVRPDGHVAFRSRRLPGDPTRALVRALRHLLAGASATEEASSTETAPV